MTFRWRTLWKLRKSFIIIITPAILSPLLALGSSEATGGFSLLLMAVYWATEAFPIAVTALLPVMLFPITGIMTGKQVSKLYINDSSMLFVGGLIMAIAVERWDLHKRIALKLLLLIGTKPVRLMLGLMLPSWFLSMWTSNMATTAMMCPIAHALLKELEHTQEEPDSDNCNGELIIAKDADDLGPKITEEMEETDCTIQVDVSTTKTPDTAAGSYGTFKETANTEITADSTSKKDQLQLSKAISLSIAYAANIGGTTTITGCASNIILKGMADELFAEYGDGQTSGINFGTWLIIAFPLSLLIFVLLFIWLQIYFRGIRFAKDTSSNTSNIQAYIAKEYKKMGSMRYPEITVLVLFIILIVLWVSRDLGGIGGWGNIFKSKYVTDSAAPTLVAVLLFLLPTNLGELIKGKTSSMRTLLCWNDVHEKLPWGLFLLFGGGFALAEGCKVSGLSNWIREVLVVFSDLPSWLTCFLVALLISLVTEVTTNTATCTLVLPIIAQLALSIDVNPLLLMIPAAVATSYAYMLPVATPPNALVYSLGYVSIPEMAKAGFVMNLVSVTVLTLAVNTWGAAYFDLHVLPEIFVDDISTTQAAILNVTVPSITNVTSL